MIDYEWLHVYDRALKGREHGRILSALSEYEFSPHKRIRPHLLCRQPNLPRGDSSSMHFLDIISKLSRWATWLEYHGLQNPTGFSLVQHADSMHATPQHQDILLV